MTAIPILLINWNNASDTLDCIRSLQAQTHADFRLLLLDNGSEAADRAQLEKGLPDDSRIQFIKSPDNLGFTRGMNFLLREYILNRPEYDYVVLLNNDTETDPGWLEKLLACARDEDAGLVSSCMVNFFDRRRLDNAGHKMLNTGEILPAGQDEPLPSYNRKRENMGACAGAALYSTDMLRDIGVFDEFFDTGYEDAELGLRAILCGYRSVYTPEAIVYHKISRSINKIRDYRYTLKIQLDIYYTCLKVLPLSVLLINLPFFLFKIGVLAVINLLFFRWKFMRVMWHALYIVTIRKGFFLKTRRQFQRQHQLIPGRVFLPKMEFFLWFDIRRFNKYILKREKMIFEKY